MTIKRLITVAFAAVFISVVSTQAQNTDTGKKNKKSLEKENTELRTRMDSLVAELDKCRAELHVSDSIRKELTAIYECQESEERTLSPEDYTAEVSDSLLNIWYVHKNTRLEEDFDIDSLKFESSVPDSVYIARSSTQRRWEPESRISLVSAHTICQSSRRHSINMTFLRNLRQWQ